MANRKWELNIIDVVDYKSICIYEGKRVICHFLTDDFDRAKSNAKLALLAPNMLGALEKVFSSSKDSGREGCTYGDTDYDSISYVEGYNQCVENMRDIVKDIIKKATE